MLKQKKLKDELERRQKKLSGIIEAEKKSVDGIAKEILFKENIKVQKKIAKSKEKLDEVNKKLKTLNLEIGAKTKIFKENKKLEEIMKLLQDKIKKKQEESANQINSLASKMQISIKAKSDELKANNNKILTLEKQLAAINSNAKKEEIQLKDNLKSAISEMEKTEKEVKKKKEELSLLNQEYEEYRLRETKRKDTVIANAKAKGEAKIKAKKTKLETCQKSMENLGESIISFKKDIEIQLSQLSKIKLRGKQLIALNKAKVTLVENLEALEKKTNEIKEQLKTACSKPAKDEQCHNLSDQLAHFLNQETELKEQIEDSIEEFEAFFEGRMPVKRIRVKATEVRKPLDIIGAYYGTLDVTHKVAAAVRNSELSIQASNKEFTDPMVRHTKTLVVCYRFGDSKPQVAMAKEGSTLNIYYKGYQRTYSAPTNAIVIFGAYYGTNNVKSKISTMVENNQLDIAANDANFGDSMPGNIKTLVIAYLDANGFIQMKAVTQGSILSLGELPIDILSKQMIITYKPTGVETPRKLYVIGAFYGTSDTSIPVNKIQGKSNHLLFNANDITFPASSVKVNPKTFAIAYRFGKSEPQLLVVAQNSSVKIASKKLPDYVYQPDKITIYKAYYGLVDVTEKVKKFISNDQTTIKATNYNLDNSNKNGPKTFVVLYQMPTGDLALQLVKEGDSLVIAPPKIR